MVKVQLVKKVYIFLWGLLFVIPGIVKAYSYRMVPYVLAEDPFISHNDAILLSRRMMDGNKLSVFVLDLSYIGWYFLTALTAGLLGIFYVNPYVYATDAELYRILRKDYVLTQ